MLLRLLLHGRLRLARRAILPLLFLLTHKLLLFLVRTTLVLERRCCLLPRCLDSGGRCCHNCTRPCVRVNQPQPRTSRPLLLFVA